MCVVKEQLGLGQPLKAPGLFALGERKEVVALFSPEPEPASNGSPPSRACSGALESWGQNAPSLLGFWLWSVGGQPIDRWQQSPWWDPSGS